jgi:diguanylate cyclase (GGDEF)-like protein/PAS domain S-box-containing protein
MLLVPNSRARVRESAGTRLRGRTPSNTRAGKQSADVRILIVEDEAASRYLLETILAANDYEVVSAGDGREGLEMAKAEPPDLIITDVLMPVMDGYQMCVQLKSDSRLRDIPVVVYTSSFGDPADKDLASSLGVARFLIKPQEPDTLVAVVRELLDHGPAPRADEEAAFDEHGVLKAYGERIAHKLYDKLLELEAANAELSGLTERLKSEADEKGRLVEQLSSAVTRQQETQEALLVSQERYVAAMRGANDGIWDWDLTTDGFFGSPKFRSILGMRDDEPLVEVEQWLSRVVPEDLERLRGEIDVHLRGLTPYLESEYQVVAPDGSRRWMLSRGQALRHEDGLAYRVAGSLSDITARKSQEQELLHSALYDKLTGLPNRTLFLDRLNFLVTRRRRHPEFDFAVMFLDLDRFKAINDSLGHTAGDSVLIDASRRLQATVRAEDTVARFGGDEFVVLVDEVKDPREVERLAERLVVELSRPFHIGSDDVFTSASIGVAMSPSDLQGSEELLRDASTAMFRAKEGGRSRFEIFDSVMHAAAVTALRTEAELRRALDREELFPYFQPVVDTKTRAVVSCEALVRWQHPERGLLPPLEFVGVAEDTGLIVPMGRHVMYAACTHSKRWHDDGNPCLKVSVNISARQFSQPGLLDTVREILEATAFPPECLVLELTESVVMSDPREAAGTLDALHDLGVELAVDDFGTGYSSLSYLKRFPFQMLKIDRGFVRDIVADADDRSIVEAIVGLAHTLNMTVVAEGVETEEQLECLSDLGCDEIQGYLISRPVPIDDFDRFLREGPPDLAGLQVS